MSSYSGCPTCGQDTESWAWDTITHPNQTRIMYRCSQCGCEWMEIFVHYAKVIVTKKGDLNYERV